MWHIKDKGILNTVHTVTLELVFGGRVLKVGKTVLEYKVISGCTIHVMAIKSKKRELETFIQLTLRTLGSLQKHCL